MLDREAGLLVMIVPDRADGHIWPVAAEYDDGHTLFQSLNDRLAISAKGWPHKQ